MTIKVFPAGKNLKSSPFAYKKRRQMLNDLGIEISTEKDSHVIVSASFMRLLPLMVKHGSNKKFLLWTNEPRFNTFFDKKIKYLSLPDLNVMNIYTGMYDNNYSWLNTFSSFFDYEIPYVSEFSFVSNRRIVALMAYRNNKMRWSLKYRGEELDLCYLRTQIALKGNKMGVLDVYGKGWSKTIKSGESRDGEWRVKKLEILKMYDFNIALENTNWPYYCTEKIWDSILSLCLPIYYGKGNRIYEDFPDNSFLDYADFMNPEELFKYISLMKPREFQDRINLCIEAFNKARIKAKQLNVDIFSTLETINRIKIICES